MFYWWFAIDQKNCFYVYKSTESSALCFRNFLVLELFQSRQAYVLIKFLYGSDRHFYFYFEKGE